MTNADKFKHLFGIYATELWAMPENDFLEWLNADAQDMPTEPERKNGEWIPEFDGKFTGGAYWFLCSKCKRIVPEVRNGGWNFCPNCGADMRGDNE